MPDPINEFAPMFPIFGPHYCGPGIVGDVSIGHRVLRADKTGTVDATDAIKAMIDASIADGADCYIPAGRYKVTPGVLVFECGAADTAFPMVYTDGAYKTIFNVNSASTVDAPIFEVRNATLSRYWSGGGFGGFAVLDTVNAAYSNRHAVSMSGWRAPTFDHIRGEKLNGALIYIPNKFQGAANPDPYAVSNLAVGILDSTECACALLNMNGLGLSDYNFRRVRAIRNREGGLRGLGIGGVVQSLGAGDCKGWLVEDLAGPQGPFSKFALLTAEIDSCQYGIRIGTCLQAVIQNVRFVHRKNAGLNTNEEFWPRIAVKLAEDLNGTLAHVRDVRIDVWHRIEPKAGAVLADLGVFFSGSSNANISNVEINQRLQDNATLGITDTSLFTQFQPTCKATYGRVNGKLILNLDNTL